MSPADWVCSLLVLATMVVVGAVALHRVLGLPTPAFAPDRAVARHVLELAAEEGWYESEWRGCTLRLDRLEGERWVVVRHLGDRVSEAVVTTEQAEDEVLRWRRGQW